ncbi:MAG: hypothetical protein MJZ16_09715 [Bacteroidales bacterium]|nr:hypothetical protein [Bacteroidales bacterium]
MRRSIIILLSAAVLLLSAVSCNSSKSKRDLGIINTELIVAAGDSTTTPEKMYGLLDEFADSLYRRVVTSRNPAVRLDAQKRASLATSLAVSVYMTDEREDLFTPVAEKLNSVLTTWGISSDPENPHLYKDIYYVTDKDTELEADGCFIMEIHFVPEDLSQVEMAIIGLPENAASDPMVVLANYLDGDTAQVDLDEAVYVDVLSMIPAGEVNPSDPTLLVMEPSFYDALMMYDVLFINYIAQSGNPESAVLRLDRLHEQLQFSNMKK